MEVRDVDRCCDCDSGTDAAGCIAGVALQPWMGLLPEWRHRPDPGDRCGSVTASRLLGGRRLLGSDDPSTTEPRCVVPWRRNPTRVDPAIVLPAFRHGERFNRLKTYRSRTRPKAYRIHRSSYRDARRRRRDALAPAVLSLRRGGSDRAAPNRSGRHCPGRFLVLSWMRAENQAISNQPRLFKPHLKQKRQNPSKPK